MLETLGCGPAAAKEQDDIKDYQDPGSLTGIGMFAAISHRIVRRFALSALPAAGVTGGLFIAMAALIVVDFKPAEAEATRLIGTITPAPIEERKISKRPKPEPIETASQPAPPPRLTVSRTMIELPTLDFPPVTPEINIGPIQVPHRQLATFDDDIRPISQPIVNYPRVAQNRGLEGECSVSMDVSAKGQPHNVAADCTDSVFEREAIRAVSRVEFRPKIVDGVAVERRNVVYPLKFNLQ